MRNGKVYYYEILGHGRDRKQKAVSDKRLGEKAYGAYVRHIFLYSRLCQAEKELLTLATDSDTLRQQLAREYGTVKELPTLPRLKQNFKPEGLLYATLRGERVRSKSEAVIADVLY